LLKKAKQLKFGLGFFKWVTMGFKLPISKMKQPIMALPVIVWFSYGKGTNSFLVNL